MAIVEPDQDDNAGGGAENVQQMHLGGRKNGIHKKDMPSEKSKGRVNLDSDAYLVKEPRALPWLHPPWRSPASLWPCDGDEIDLLDKALSASVFRLRLRRETEAVLSIPACLLSLPAFPAIAPSLLIIAGAGKHSGWLLIGGTCAGLAAMLFLWCAGLAKERPMRQLQSPFLVLVAPVIGLTVPLLLGGEETRKLHGLGCFYMFAWFAVDLPVSLAKKMFRRRRPIACDARDIGEEIVKAASEKGFSFLGRMLLHIDPNTSFPSADVAIAVSFAFPLSRCGIGAALFGALCTLTCAFGRMYWQAHHLLDVLAGGLLGLIVCFVLDQALASVYFVDAYVDCGGVCNARWWHYIVAQAAHLVANEWANSYIRPLSDSKKES